MGQESFKKNIDTYSIDFVGVCMDGEDIAHMVQVDRQIEK